MSDLSNIEKRSLERLFGMGGGYILDFSNRTFLEAFNRVRNDQSFAHDNQVLNYDESLLIFNHVASAIRFIEAVERRISHTEKHSASIIELEDDVPF